MTSTLDESKQRLNANKTNNMISERNRVEKEDQSQQLVRREGEERLTTYPVGWRHVVTVTAFVGFFCMYSLRINMSVALVAMLNKTALSALKENATTVTTLCMRHDQNNDTTHDREGRFVWDSEVQGIILSSFFYGYIMTQFAGGVLAGKYGAKWVFGIGNLMTGVFALLSPLAAEIGLGSFIAVRILQGFSSGVTWPSMQSFFSRWAPPSERSTLPAFAYAGSFVGTPITFALSGILAHSNFLGGWPSVFYVFGIICCVWFVFWAILSSSGPENHRFISRGEQTYITKSLHEVHAGQSRPALKDVPWKHIFTSWAFWAVVVSHFTYNWGLYVLMTALPTYFNRVQGFDIKKNGVLSALPYLVQFILHVSTARVADFLRVRYSLKTLHVRKMFDCLGHLLPAIFVTTLAFVGCDETAAVSLLVLTVGFTGLCSSGWFVNFLDIAPRYAGILLGVSNTFSTVPGIVGPYLTGRLTKQNTVEGWQAVFLIIACFYTFSAVFFFFFGQGVQQPWAAAPKNIASGDNEPPQPNDVNKSTSRV